jgi:RNA polymerase sigma-70 factor, ECF subfamily
MRAAQRDPRCFAPIYERYVARIYTYCLRRVNGDVQEAEDLTSQVFTRALTCLDQYRGGLLAAWLFQIAHHTVVNAWKRPRREVPLDDELRLTGRLAEPLEHVIQAEEEEKLRDLIARLPEDQQEIVLLKVVGGLSSAEIGELLGKSAGAVRVMFHRIMRQLYSAYQQAEGETTHAE